MCIIFCVFGTDHSEIAKFVLKKHPQLLHVRDHQGRTAKDIAKEKNEHSIMRVIKTAELEMEMAKYSFSSYGKALTAFLVPFIFYVILIFGLTSVGFWLTVAMEGIFIGVVRVYSSRIMPRHDETNTLILGIYYSSFMISVAGYWYKIGQCTSLDVHSTFHIHFQTLMSNPFSSSQSPSRSTHSRMLYSSLWHLEHYSYI
jgi:hypothetical protein